MSNDNTGRFLLAMLGVCCMAFESQARILVETCTNYNIHTVINMPNGAAVTFDAPGRYCWNEYLPESGDQPYESPLDLPGFDDPEIPDDRMCAATMLAWPSGCDKNNAPKAIPNGCTAVPDSDGFAADFTSSCNSHDLCYTTVGSSKGVCDTGLGRDMVDACNETYTRMIDRILHHLGPLYIVGQLQTIHTLSQHQIACIAQASAYEDGVKQVSATRYFPPAQALGKCIDFHRKRKLYCGN